MQFLKAETDRKELQTVPALHSFKRSTTAESQFKTERREIIFGALKKEFTQ